MDRVEGMKPDLILLDVMMPGISGYEVCKRLQGQAETAEIPVIFVTALGEERDKARAFAVGASDYLVKPFTKEGLLTLVQSHLERVSRWREASTETRGADRPPPVVTFREFKTFLLGQLTREQQARVREGRLSSGNFYERCSSAGIEPATVAQWIADFVKAPFLPVLNPGDLRLGVLSTRFCKSNNLVPLQDAGAGLAFAVSNPFELEIQDTLRTCSRQGQTVRVVVTEPENIERLFRDVEEKSSLEDLYKEMTVEEREAADAEDVAVMATEEADEGDLEQSAQDALVVKLANELIARAIQYRASDLHVEPRETSVGVRYRIDGTLSERDPLPKRMGPPLTSRYKIMASLDIAKRRVPQDGRIRVSYREKKLDLRVSTLPTRYGEKVVIRIQDFAATSLNFDSLGFEGRSLEVISERIRKPHGILLVTGPTGSGKTTTLYTALQALNEPEKNIVTVEDPIENELHRITQVQVHPEAGLTFPVALRSILRQDPDIIMVGEIRDLETADIAIKAALTGHLVLSTLHTNDAPGTILRLIDMGVAPFLVASSIEMVLAQRLLRKLCPHCKKPVRPSESLRDRIKALGGEEAQFFDPVGCEKCNGIGYRGRTGAFEVLTLDETLRERISRSAGADAIRAYAAKHLGFTTLRQDAFHKAARGETSLKEVLRASG